MCPDIWPPWFPSSFNKLANEYLPLAVRPRVPPGAGVAHVLVGRDGVLVELALGERRLLHSGARGAEVVLQEWVNLRKNEDLKKKRNLPNGLAVEKYNHKN